MENISAVQQASIGSIVVGRPNTCPLLSEAREFIAAGDFCSAEVACFTILSIKPDHLPTLLVLVEAFLQNDKLSQALQLARVAVDLASRNALTHLYLARTYHCLGDLEPARASYLEAINIDPTLSLAYCNLALVHLEMREYREAILRGRKALELDCRMSAAALVVGRAFFALDDFDWAEQYLLKVLALDPDMVSALNVMGRIVQRLRRSDDAIVYHERALALEPRSAMAWEGIGLAQRALGRFDAAIAAFERAIAIDPDLGEAHYALSICRQAEQEEPNIKTLLRTLGAPDLPVSQQISMHFALGKQLDDLAVYDEAFSHYEKGNRLSREDSAARGYRFSIPAFRAQISSTINKFRRAFFEEHGDCGVVSQLPVFIVGHPRSGTSLIEQVLSSHPSVHGAGELLQLAQLNHRVTRHWDRHGYINHRALRREAIIHLKQLTLLSNGATRVVDKLPDNVLLLGLIVTMFPQARIIFCHRDIRDNVLSCFFQRFSDGLVFSTDLTDCMHRHIQVERLMSHWHAVLPTKTIDMNYERLVEDFEGQSRRLIEFLDLPWDANCLDFDKIERTVNTASVWSVRQPIYESSVGRWRNYERHIVNLLPTIQRLESGAAEDYECQLACTA